ncbi:MAG: M14 family metallopeptidase [Gemmatimonadota bacterium]|nr:M14 family metallopeptidase [Gemmatimonadota bacterium]
MAHLRFVTRRILASLLVLVAASPAVAQDLRTRAERTDFVETSRYEDVIAFVDAVVTSSEALHRLEFGYTWEGRALPLVVWDPTAERGAYATPIAIEKAAGDRLRVLVFANIHAGEVAGKEAALVLLRDLAAGLHDRWSEDVVLAVAPIYNADGNERIALDNRPLQHGPIGGMGERANAQGLDLNRDFTKLEAPETRSLVRLIDEGDFHLVVDLHTTNGTIHGYHLTYAPPLHPSTDPAIDRFLRDEWLPGVTRALGGKGGRVPHWGKPSMEALRRDGRWNAWHYGNLPGDAGADGERRGWYTYSPRPRFGINAIGLRNRFGILSEAYAYLPFEERVAVTLRFVEEIVDFAADRAEEIRSIVQASDARSLVGDTLALASEPVLTHESAPILLGEVVEERHPYTGERILRRVDSTRVEPMPAYVGFRPATSEVVPSAYLVPADLVEVVELLEAHGIETRRTEADREGVVEAFRITASELAVREFQGHRIRTLEGEWIAGERTVPAGTVVVPMDQPLARLAFALLEPASDDGFVAWNVLDDALEDAAVHPVLRVPRRNGPESR